MQYLFRKPANIFFHTPEEIIEPAVQEVSVLTASFPVNCNVIDLIITVSFFLIAPQKGRRRYFG